MRIQQNPLTRLMAWGSIALAATISATLSAQPSGAAPAQNAPSTATPARELVRTYCVSCHNDRVKTANLSLDAADADHVSNSAETWEKVVVKLRSRSMPPV